MKKFFIYSGLVIFILLLSYLTVSFWLVQSTAGRAQARRAAIAAAGDNVYLTDYEIETIPDEENAYHYLMLARADLEAFQKEWQSIGESLELERRLRPEHVDELAAIVAKYPAMFERLEQAAACENYQAPHDYSQGLSLLMPHIHDVRWSARALSARALVAAYQGDGDAALEQCGVSLRLASLLRHEPTLISHLVNIASQGIAVLTANHSLRVAETSPDARDRLDGILANLDNRQGTLDAMKGERAMGILTFQQMRSGTLDPNSLGGGGGGGSGFSVVSSTWLGQAYLNDDEAKYIEILDKQIEAAELPKQQREELMQPVWDDLQQSRFRHVFSRLLVPALESAVNASDRVEAANRCLRVLLAVEGQEDVDLQDVDLLAAAKTDPYSGGPLLMSRKEGGLVVYSVFKNLSDDGGEVYFSKTNGDPLDIGLGPLLEPLEEDTAASDLP